MLTLALVILCVAPALSARLPFIVNGKDVDHPGKYNWQISYQVFGSHSCGGAIVSSSHVITASHCIFSYDVYVQILAGAHDINTLQQGKPTYYGIRWQRTNPDYEKGTALSEADVAVIQISGTFDFNDFVGKIDLPESTVGDLAGASCVITGWGNTRIGSTHPPNILQEASTKPLSLAVCKAKVAAHPMFTADDVYAGHICIGSLGFEGSCHGDSGGPLTCKTPSGTTVLAGVTSWGDPQCNTIYPTMYTRISYHRKWIGELTGL